MSVFVFLNQAVFVCTHQMDEPGMPEKDDFMTGSSDNVVYFLLHLLAYKSAVNSYPIRGFIH